MVILLGVKMEMAQGHFGLEPLLFPLQGWKGGMSLA
jgi:hypothetical protein